MTPYGGSLVFRTTLEVTKPGASETINKVSNYTRINVWTVKENPFPLCGTKDLRIAEYLICVSLCYTIRAQVFVKESAGNVFLNGNRYQSFIFDETIRDE